MIEFTTFMTNELDITLMEVRVYSENGSVYENYIIISA